MTYNIMTAQIWNKYERRQLWCNMTDTIYGDEIYDMKYTREMCVCVCARVCNRSKDWNQH